MPPSFSELRIFEPRFNVTSKITFGYSGGGHKTVDAKNSELERFVLHFNITDNNRH
jgi:hypothetical protein